MDTSKFAAELDRWLLRRGDGAADALALALDVTPASVSRWRNGHDRPSPSRWPAIEAFFALETGTVGELLTKTRAPSGRGELERLTDALEQLRGAVERNTSVLEQRSASG
jgi:Helix-turn-helix